MAESGFYLVAGAGDEVQGLVGRARVDNLGADRELAFKADQQCLELVPLEEIEFPEPVLAQLKSSEAASEVELRGITADELGQKNLSGAVMVKDETRCIRCGLCALRCPVNEITMEAFHFRSAENTGLISIQSFDLRSNE